jgi:putative membrane protein
MKILLSIIINSLILFIIAYFLQANTLKHLDSGIILGCSDCSYNSILAWKTYLLWWIVLGLMNIIIKPILKILSIPLFFIFFWLVVFIVNAIILFLLDYILTDLLIIKWIWYHINWILEFTIAVVIFTILNMIYSLLFFKK